MIPLPFAAGVFTLLTICIGIIHLRLERRVRAVKHLEKLLADSNREVASLEMLKSSVLSRIGDVLATPLKVIESSSERLANAESGLSDSILSDLNRLTEEVHSLIRILNVFEEITSKEDDPGDGAETLLHAVRMDEIVSEAAMELSEPAADKMVSLSVSICGSVEVMGRNLQLTEAVTSMLWETLKRADPGTVMSIELRAPGNMELEAGWVNEGKAVTEEENLLATGLTKLIASSHGGWVSEDFESGRITLILPLAGEKHEH
jgi:K+-sensing histidine kinase KdpD